eukprot:TRINITY_DN1749_c2_g1_i1.p1 TRINITY_DN1749_c2_g1~~TRINITY_DN1749_c2_g1_i1.p1  ORF type:complete len:942 (+),score=164.76 TRINITY_DN1749_c2_g1_i1:430-3255(+)
MHQLRTITGSQWIKIPFVNPMLLLEPASKECGLYQSDVASRVVGSVDLSGVHFYSTTYDATQPWCGINQSGSKEQHSHEGFVKSVAELWKKCDCEYIWNSEISSDFKKLGLASQIPPILRGMAETTVLSSTGNGTDVFATLITRQKNLNPGSRYESRGLSSTSPGCGNEYECEQIVFHEYHKESGLLSKPLGLKFTKSREHGPLTPTSQSPSKGFEQALVPSVYSWSSFTWARGTVPLMWSHRLKKTQVTATLTVDKQPFRGVADYWQRFWSRHQTKNVLNINLLRNTLNRCNGNTVVPSWTDSLDEVEQRTVSPNSSPQLSAVTAARCTSPVDLSLSRSEVKSLSTSTSNYVDEAAQVYILGPYNILGNSSWPAMESPNRKARVVKNFKCGDVVTATPDSGGWLRIKPTCWVMARSDRYHNAGWHEIKTMSDSLPKADVTAEDVEFGIEMGYNINNNSDLFQKPLSDGDGDDDDTDSSISDTDLPMSGGEEDEAPSPSKLGSHSPTSLPIEQSGSRILSIREDQIIFKGESLLTYFFELSLFALDRRLQRDSWSAQGMPRQSQAPSANLKLHNTIVKHLDWHGSCKKYGEKRTIETLWDIALPTMKEHGVTSGVLSPPADSGSPVVSTLQSRQIGITRVNCADSLDRTNVACFYLCLQALGEQYHHLASVDSDLVEGCPGESWPLCGTQLDNAVVEIPRSVLSALAMCFIDNGDACATLYCNSPAMHSGPLRSYLPEDSKGRHKKTNISISLSRRFQNQFTDRKRTRSINLLLGSDSLLNKLVRSSAALATIWNGVGADMNTSVFISDHQGKGFDGCKTFCWQCIQYKTDGVPLVECQHLSKCVSVIAVFDTPELAIKFAALDSSNRFVLSSSQSFFNYQASKLSTLKLSVSKKYKAQAALMNMKNAAVASKGDIVKNVKKRFAWVKDKIEGGKKTPPPG